MGWSLDMLNQVDCSMIIREVFSSFCNNSQACERRNKHIHIVRYSKGPLYLGEMRISINNPLGLCFYNDNDKAQKDEKHRIAMTNSCYHALFRILLLVLSHERSAKRLRQVILHK